MFFDVQRLGKGNNVNHENEFGKRMSRDVNID